MSKETPIQLCPVCQLPLESDNHTNCRQVETRESSNNALTSEQLKAIRDIVVLLERGNINAAIESRDAFAVPTSPEIMAAAEEKMIYYLQKGYISVATEIRDAFAVPQDRVLAIAEAAIIKRLQHRYMNIDDVKRIRDDFAVPISPEIMAAAEAGMIYHFQEGFTDTAIEIRDTFAVPTSPEIMAAAEANILCRLQYQRIDVAKRIRDAFAVPQDRVIAAAEAAIIEKLQGRDIDAAKRICAAFEVPQDRVIAAAEAEIIKKLQDNKIYDAAKIRDAFAVPQDRVLAIAEAAIIEHLQHRYMSIDAVKRIRDDFAVPISPEITAAAEAKMIDLLHSEHLYYIPEIRDTFAVPTSPEIITAVQAKMIEKLREGDIKIVKEIRDAFAVLQESIFATIGSVMVECVEQGDKEYATLIGAAFEVPQDRVIAAAEAEITKKLQDNKIYDAAKIRDAFAVPQDRFISIAEAAIIEKLQGRDIGAAKRIRDDFAVPISPEITAAAEVAIVFAVDNLYTRSVFEIADSFDVRKSMIELIAMLCQNGADPARCEERLQEAGLTWKTIVDENPSIASIIDFYQHGPRELVNANETWGKGVTIEALSARQTHQISPQEYIAIEHQNPDALQLDEQEKANPESLGDALEEIMRKNGEDESIIEAFRTFREHFGAAVTLRYANRPDLSRHDAFFSVHDIISLHKQSGLSVNEFANNILFQASDSDASYTNGTAQHELNSVANGLASVDVVETLDRAKAYPNIQMLHNLVQELRSERSGVFSSWKKILQFRDLHQLLERNEILEELSEGDITPELRCYVEKLAFHPNISTKKVIAFWKDPEGFLGIEDIHTDELINAVKKPSNYLSLPFLGLKAEDLRDAFVEGNLDALQTLPPMERTYRFYDSGQDPMVPEHLHKFMLTTVGSRREKIQGLGKNPTKVFHNVRLFCNEQGINFDQLWDKTKGIALLTELSEEQRRGLVTVVFDAQFGVPEPAHQVYRLRIGKKSDPDMAIAGNDTASCMPFGSGKNNVYMFNPNCVQMVCERKTGDGTWRTAAQSVVTLDAEASLPTPELIDKFMKTNSRLDEFVEDEDFTRLLAVTCDNIEVAKNTEGRRNDAVRELYMRFFIEYLTEHGDELGVRKDKVIVGVGYTPDELGLPIEENKFVPLAPMGYSDNVHGDCFVIKTGLEKETSQTRRPTKGVSRMRTRDVLAVAYIEGKAYHDNESVLEYLHGMQNNIIGMEIANAKFDRPNLSFVYREQNGIPNGYILAYEGVNGGQPEIYLSDLAASPDSKLAGGRLIKQFFETYTKNYGTDQKPFIPIYTNAREQTSYQIIVRQVKRMAEKAGLKAEAVNLGQTQRGGDTFYDVRICIGRTNEEVADMKEKYGTERAVLEAYNGQYDDGGDYYDDWEDVDN